MRIVQISDLHIGGLFKQDIFDTLVDEINNDLQPDVIIVSGDLTDDGLVFQFEQARREIQKLKCSNLIVFPGNHDYRHTGYLLFEKYFPGSISSNQVHEFSGKNNSKEKIVLITVGTAVPDKDEGEVGYRQNLWLNDNLTRFNNRLSNGQRIIKIVAMHHHLISIPDTGYTSVVGISDAGDVLRTCLENEVDLVICGHKHRPWIWNLGNMRIAYAGTACSWRYRGIFKDTYNIINISDNNIVNIEMKVVGEKSIPLSEVVKRYEPEAKITNLSKIITPTR
ncbi:MAG TPA: metallophosphoesterase [Nitrososphaeraceae archaeon]|jgi:3',5'-cyclic AMP phosphodiesterase CpdA